jgi:hypothetical protein
MSGVAATSVPRAAHRRKAARAAFVVLVAAAAMTTGLLSSRGPADGAVVAVGLALVGGFAAMKLTATDAPIERHPIDQVGWFVATAFVLYDAWADMSGSDAFASWTPGKWGFPLAALMLLAGVHDGVRWWANRDAWISDSVPD